MAWHGMACDGENENENENENKNEGTMMRWSVRIATGRVASTGLLWKISLVLFGCCLRRTVRGRHKVISLSLSLSGLRCFVPLPVTSCHITSHRVTSRHVTSISDADADDFLLVGRTDGRMNEWMDGRMEVSVSPIRCLDSHFCGAW